MNIRIFSDERTAAVYAAAVIEYVVQTTEHPVLGLATGSTPVPLYDQLVEFHQAGLSFAHVTTINLDEYVGLPPSHPQSYHAFMEEHLFRYIDVRKENTNIPRGDVQDLAGECKRYDEVIKNHPIDVQVLGIGVNGHIGFNEPDSVLKVGTHVVTLAEETIAANSRFFASTQEVPNRAITVGLQPILRAKKVLLLAFGEAKAQAVMQAISGDVRTSLPASILQVHPNVTFVLDQGAARVFLEEEKRKHATYNHG
ncbi:glucosamine-6-phosphate deaminase [Alicyclobacillus tolerans]|uniref:glucosamine-6-phosphate deaminase n=1 Tax=Alicyclobacillus tolerans TaxID=90970 RepID=UPI001F00E37C|nr:glucosamine-6-phosphate deaminase [Alicyclobacillus tolerans]MCF8566670.1 glucosamine-6-phosphate deaminase [Alicyclobacillus tolerans]